MKTLNFKSKGIPFHIFLLSFVFFLGATPKSLNATNPDFKLHVHSWAGYDYDHPFSVDLFARYLPELTYDGDMVTLDQIQGLTNISFDLTFLVNDDIYQWDIDLIALMWGEYAAGPFFDVTPALIEHDGQLINAIHVDIHDPYGFFSTTRPFFEFPPQSTGTPVAVVEGQDMGYVLYPGACGLPQFIFDECSALTPIVENALITEVGNSADDLDAEGYGSQTCNLIVEFPPCVPTVYDPESDGPDPGDGGGDGEPDTGNPVGRKSLSIEERGLNLTLFPNPAHSYVAFDLNEKVEDYRVELIDFQGKVLKVQSGQSKSKNHLDLTNLTPGVYYVRISSGKFTDLKKLLLF